MPERSGQLSQICFRFPCQDVDLPRLALGVLNAYQAQRFAARHALALDEVPAEGDLRAFALLVGASRLEEVLLGLRSEGILFGPVECGDEAALKTCQELGVAGKLRPTAGPAEGAGP
jgi:hypothetical protein